MVGMSKDFDRQIGRDSCDYDILGEFSQSKEYQCQGDWGNFLHLILSCW